MKPVLLILLFGSVSLAQVSTGTFYGRILDESGAAIQDASVTALDEATGFRWSIRSGVQGKYRFGELPPGSYALLATKSGFQAINIAHARLEVNEDVQLDATMKVGVASDSVTISADDYLIQADDSTGGFLIDSAMTQTLPLDGRNVFSLVTLGPGSIPRQLGGFVHDVNNDIQAGTRGSVALNAPINGARSNMNAYLIDGAYDTDRNAFAAAVIPPLEAVQEFRTQTSVTPADEFQTGGGLINIVTKSGSKSFHGNIFDYVRNEVTDAKNYFDDPSIEKPIFRRNQYGASLGGPLSHSTFFFSTYEGLRDTTTTPSAQIFPDPIQRSGNFGAEMVYDPLSAADASQRTPFANNTIPANRLDPIAQKYLARFLPLPNRVGGSTNFVDATPSADHHDTGSTRVDHQFSRAGVLFGRYTFNNDRNDIGGNYPVLPSQERLFAQQFVLAHTLTSAHVVNDFRAAFTRLRLFDLPETALHDNIQADLGLSNPPTDPFAFGLPYFVVSNFSTVTDDPSLPQTQRDNTWSLDEGLTIERGAHTFRMGGDGIYFQFNYRNSQTARGQYTYTGEFTGSGTQLGDPLADFLLGFPTQTTRTVGSTQAYLRQHSLAGYVSDTWKITPSITVNTGVRYEFNSPFSDANRSMLNLDYSSLPADPRLIPVAQSFRPNYHDFAPKAGLAYRLPGIFSRGGPAVLRAGYGIYYSPEIAIEDYDLVLNGIVNQTNTANGDTFPTLTTKDGFPSGGDNGLPSYYGVDRYAPTPYMQEWNAGIQRELPMGVLLEVSYVGSKGTHLGLFRRFNTPLHTESGEDLDPRPGDLQALRTFPDLGMIIQRQHVANSSYNALQIKVEKRMARTLSFLGSYVWSKSIDDAASVIPSTYDSVGATDENDLRTGRGLSFFNVPRRISAGFTWNLPQSSYMKRITSNWQLDGTITLQDGTPLDPIYYGLDFSNTGTPNRPNVVLGQTVSLPASQRTPDHWFNTAAFSDPAPFTFGNAGRDTIPGPGNEVIDEALHRTFPLTERMSISLRGEVFNTLNHPNFGIPGPYVDFGPLFGKILSSGQPRRMQFAARFDF